MVLTGSQKDLKKISAFQQESQEGSKQGSQQESWKTRVVDNTYTQISKELMQPLPGFLTNEQCQNSKLINYECASQFSILRTLQTSIKRETISQNCYKTFLLA